MLYIVSYDVTDDRRRTRLHGMLKGFGRRVQFSVFECELSVAEVEELAARVAFELDTGEDSCRMYPLCSQCRESVRVVGRGDLYREPDVIVV